MCSRAKGKIECVGRELESGKSAGPVVFVCRGEGSLPGRRRGQVLVGPRGSVEGLLRET